MTPESRVRIVHQFSKSGECVVYWMTSARRSNWNHGLQHAINLSKRKNLPLVVLEPLSIAHRWANERSHAFVIEGMLDNKVAFENSPITYIPYLETKQNEGRRLLEKWMEYANVMVVDEFPTYHPRRVTELAISLKKCEIHSIDSNGFISMNQNRSFTTAHSLRRHLHKTIMQHMSEFPSQNPIEMASDLPTLPSAKVVEIFEQSNTPMTSCDIIVNICDSKEIKSDHLSILDLDHSVTRVKHAVGGSNEALRQWRKFLKHRLMNYSKDRNEPELNGSSGLSPYPVSYTHLTLPTILRV